jgi:hypothetical protein
VVGWGEDSPSGALAGSLGDQLGMAMTDKWSEGMRAIGGDADASTKGRSVQVWRRVLIAWAVVGAAFIALPVFVGGSFDPCQAAVNSLLRRQPAPAPVASVAGQYLTSGLRQKGIFACYRATFTEAFE